MKEQYWGPEHPENDRSWLPERVVLELSREQLDDLRNYKHRIRLITWSMDRPFKTGKLVREKAMLEKIANEIDRYLERNKNEEIFKDVA